MTGAGKRRKGAGGELEVRDLIRKHGFECERDGRLDDDLQHNVAGFHFEVKRQEIIEIGRWTRQAEADAKGRVPCVAYRRSGQPWRASLPLEELLALLAISREKDELQFILDGLRK